VGAAAQRDGEREELDAWHRRPVALRRSPEAEALVDRVRAAHLGLARADDPMLAAAAAVVEDTPDERRAHAPALYGRVDGEHAELGLVRAGDLAERPAVGYEGHRADHAGSVRLHGDEQLRLGRTPRRIAQHGHVVVAGEEGRVGGHAEVCHGREVGGGGRSDLESHVEPDAGTRLLLVHGDGFVIRPMTETDARAVAAWHYPGVYSFYDWDQDPDDLAELLDPAEWGGRYFAVDDQHEQAGLFVFKLLDGVAEIGLGLRPDLAGRGRGDAFVDAGLRFAAATLGAQSYTLAVAAFNRRAIKVYERAGFAEVERYQHRTNGGVHAFVRMTRGPLQATR
jgi:ribosomal-protein-alanine N-acetyltransferase